MGRIGLVAGEGKLPLIFARAAAASGETVIAFGLKGVTDPALEEAVAKLHWLEWGGLQKGLFLLATERLKRLVMLGKIRKDLFFRNEEKLDAKARAAVTTVSGKKDYAILAEVAKFFAKLGVEVVSPAAYLAEAIPRSGLLTARSPTPAEEADIAYGKNVASALAGYDIGQTVVVKDRTVIAVEAAEGTDETIRRAGTLSRIGFSVVKMARPDQDMRFDIPLVGLDTVTELCRAGGAALALEAEKTLLIERDAIVRLADEKGVSIVVI